MPCKDTKDPKNELILKEKEELRAGLELLRVNNVLSEKFYAKIDSFIKLFEKNNFFPIEQLYGSFETGEEYPVASRTYHLKFLDKYNKIEANSLIIINSLILFDFIYSKISNSFDLFCRIHFDEDEEFKNEYIYFKISIFKKGVGQWDLIKPFIRKNSPFANFCQDTIKIFGAKYKLFEIYDQKDNMRVIPKGTIFAPNQGGRKTWKSETRDAHLSWIGSTASRSCSKRGKSLRRKIVIDFTRYTCLEKVKS